MVIVVVVPNGPGDWKSSAQSEPLPPPPVKSQPAPSRAWNSTSYVPAATGPITTLKEPLPFMSVVTTPSSIVTADAVTPCRVSWVQVPPPRSTGNWPKVAGNVVQKGTIPT